MIGTFFFDVENTLGQFVFLSLKLLALSYDKLDSSFLSFLEGRWN